MACTSSRPVWTKEEPPHIKSKIEACLSAAWLFYITTRASAARYKPHLINIWELKNVQKRSQPPRIPGRQRISWLRACDAHFSLAITISPGERPIQTVEGRHVERRPSRDVERAGSGRCPVFLQTVGRRSDLVRRRVRSQQAARQV